MNNFNLSGSEAGVGLCAITFWGIPCLVMLLCEVARSLMGIQSVGLLKQILMAYLVGLESKCFQSKIPSIVRRSA